MMNATIVLTSMVFVARPVLNERLGYASEDRIRSIHTISLL
jgi:hypothetical protein